MNLHLKTGIGHSVCPHDCPSTCALDIELLGNNRIGRVHGAADNSYTAGVICAKVARYAERVHHPDRLLKPLVRSGAKGEGAWKEASWEAALDLVAEKFIAAVQRMDEVSACWTMTGDYDFLLHVMVPNVDDLNAFVMHRLMRLQGVRDVHTQLVLQNIKGPGHVPLAHLRG